MNINSHAYLAFCLVFLSYFSNNHLMSNVTEESVEEMPDTYDPYDLSHLECGHCKRNVSHCKILTTGYSCSHYGDLGSVVTIKSYPSINYIDKNLLLNNSQHLDKCLPDVYGLTFISKHCCFWSPKLGCTQVKHKSSLSDLCNECFRNKKNKNKGCECSKANLWIGNNNHAYIYYVALFCLLKKLLTIN
ncbi:uncharacterized protein LOC111519364 [Drosophila willistoni]|uniref:uncharacterized protein LOC111519364 n=1 Tax=Drosophila willistoni TaxID=7260 RepID=UPI001F07F163|nr:uncharacterized protein LOC111519364 [Drosophila willistoni]